MEHGSRRTMVIPNQRRHAGFAATPAYAGTSFHICLLNSGNLCLQSNGVTNQVTITSDAGNWSVFTEKNLFYNVYSFENGNGNCLRENNSQEVVIANGPCVASDTDADWNWLSNSGGYTGVWQNVLTGDEMLVHDAVSGYKVWAKPTPASGDWTKWNPPGS